MLNKTNKLNVLLNPSLSPNISKTLLIRYLKNCSNSRQTKQNGNTLSVRNLSNEQQILPIQVNHIKHKIINQHSMYTNDNNIANTINNKDKRRQSNKQLSKYFNTKDKIN